MKKSPPTPDVNEKAPRPRRQSSGSDDIPTMDSPPRAPSETSTGFDRATDETDQEYRSGLLPGADDNLAPEDPVDLDDDIDLAEGVDPEPYKEFWAERQSFPQQNDPDQEGLWEEGGPDDLTLRPAESDSGAGDDGGAVADPDSVDEPLDRSGPADNKEP